MYGLKVMLKRELLRLNTIQELAKSDCENMPEGKLRISKSRKTVQYYLRNEESGSSNGIYIPKSDAVLPFQLAQKTYAESILRITNKRIRQISQILRDYEDNEIENAFTRLSEERKRLVSPFEMTWEQRKDAWIKEEYQGKGFAENEPEIYSEKGERVRSKSERSIANYLYRNGIPYKYEKPLYLREYGTVYPDFTILSRRTQGEIYWEHEGRMDDHEYVIKAIKKIKTYERNNIFVGDKLILSYETKESVLNMSEIESLCRRYII